jgi:ABC-type transport system involved in multi-copper enzyme maturation permease subunit
VNNCIGRSNYRYFVQFLLSLVLYIVTILAFSLLYVLENSAPFTTANNILLYPSNSYFLFSFVLLSACLSSSVLQNRIMDYWVLDVRLVVGYGIHFVKQFKWLLAVNVAWTFYWFINELC